MTLTDRELEVIRRIQAGAFPHPEFQAYPDYVDYFTHEKEVMPLEGGDEPKRRFIPSKVSDVRSRYLHVFSRPSVCTPTPSGRGVRSAQYCFFSYLPVLLGVSS